MMQHRHALPALLCAAALTASGAFAQSAPLADDGPWIDIPPGTVINTAAPTYDDIVAMADLDGDPSVTTEEELQMIAVLTQVLGSRPVAD